MQHRIERIAEWSFDGNLRAQHRQPLQPNKITNIRRNEFASHAFKLNSSVKAKRFAINRKLFHIFNSLSIELSILLLNIFDLNERFRMNYSNERKKNTVSIRIDLISKSD